MEELKHRIEKLEAENSALREEIEIQQNILELLRKNEEKFRNLIENSRDLIYRISRNNVCEYISPSCAVITGYAPEQWYSNPMLLRETVHPDFIEGFTLVWNNIWKGSIEPYYEYKIFHKSGDIRWVRQRSFLIHDDSGTVIAVEGYIADITYLKRSEEDLQKLILSLKRSNEDLDEFATAASHDLQEPLMVISNFGQILMNDYLDRLDNKGKDFLRYIFDASNRMRGLLNGLLAYSRITAGRYYRTIVPVKSVVSSALENLDISLKEHMADIILELPDDIIICDPYQIARAIQNIVSNSLKFSDKKMPLIKIKAVLREDIWTFTIEDNGIGIDKENVDKIFQIFYRGDSEYSGTGIGLAMAKKIIARHGGSITVSSVKGEGSTFTFTLPRTTEPI